MRGTVVGVIVAVLALGACAASSAPGGVQNPNPGGASGAPSTATGSGGSTGAGRVPPALRGTYTSSVVGTTASSGTWILEATATDLFLTNPIGGDPFSIDVSAISDTQLTVPASSDCPDQTTVTDGQYTISLKGDQLTLTVLHDSCGDRKAILSTNPWTRRP